MMQAVGTYRDNNWKNNWSKRHDWLKKAEIKAEGIKVAFRGCRSSLSKPNYFCPGLRTSLVSLVFNRTIFCPRRANKILASKFSNPNLEPLNLNEQDGARELEKLKNVKELNGIKVNKLIGGSSKGLEESVFNRAEQLETEAIFKLAQEAHKNGQKGFAKIFFSYLTNLLSEENLKEF
jgi:hypothetical protein